MPDLELHAARVATALGDTNAAVRHLEYALAPPTRHAKAFVHADMRFAPLRADPRFVATLDSLRVPNGVSR
jgi:hypothetical protein